MKLPNEDKSFNKFAKRLVEAERKHPVEKTKREETDSEIEARFAKLREARAKERYGWTWRDTHIWRRVG